MRRFGYAVAATFAAALTGALGNADRVEAADWQFKTPGSEVRLAAANGQKAYVFKLYDRNARQAGSTGAGSTGAGSTGAASTGASPTGSLAQRQEPAPRKPVDDVQLKSQLVNADRLTATADARPAPQSSSPRTPVQQTAAQQAAAAPAQQPQTFDLSAIQPAGAIQSPGQAPSQSPGAIAPAAGGLILAPASQTASASVVAANAGSAPLETQTAFGISPPGDPYAGILSEVRVGLLAHDVGLVSGRTETGVDFNGELLFASPDFFKYIGSPRPHLGFSLNSSGDTSQGYFGVTWGLDIWRGLFFELGFGGSVHSGILTSSDPDSVLDDNEFGCRLLFRESLELGWRFNQRHSISAMVDHISNAGICDANDGMDNAGVRYGYKF